MDIFLKAAALAIICTVFYLVLSKGNKDIAVVLSLAATSVLIAAAVSYLDGVMDFLQHLVDMGKLDSNAVKILLKATGISIISEFCGVICSDAGNSALGKGIQFLAVGLILWLSLPLFMNLISLVSNLLEKV